MNPLDLFQRGGNALPTASRREIVSRYQNLRKVCRNLNHKLVARLSKDMLQEGGKKLGILRRGVLVFDSEDETAVLMDYCLYDVRRKGRNAIEECLIDFPPDPDSAEMLCLQAMRHAVYSLFVVESVERGVGVEARNLVSNETSLIVDGGMSSSARPGLIFASRLLFVDDFSMTGGAALPIGVPSADVPGEILKELASVAPGDGGFSDPAPLIRECLRRGCSSRIRYQEPTEPIAGRQELSRELSNGVRSATVGKNAYCPCGSGRKFKHCCQKR